MTASWWQLTVLRSIFMTQRGTILLSALEMMKHKNGFYLHKATSLWARGRTMVAPLTTGRHQLPMSTNKTQIISLQIEWLFQQQQAALYKCNCLIYQTLDLKFEAYILKSVWSSFIYKNSEISDKPKNCMYSGKINEEICSTPVTSQAQVRTEGS